MTVVDDPEPAYFQADKMTALANRARSNGAAWIVPFDADKLWFARRATLKTYLTRLDPEVDVVVANWYHHFPSLVTRRGTPFERMAWRETYRLLIA